MGSAFNVCRKRGRSVVSELPEVSQLPPEEPGNRVREVERDVVRTVEVSADRIAGWDDCTRCKEFVGQEEVIRGIRLTAEDNDLSYEDIRIRVIKMHHYSHEKGVIQ